MFFKKLNNAGLRDIIQKLRELIKVEKYLKKEYAGIAIKI